MKIYAKVGDAFQQIGGECPDGCIEMTSPRPGDFYIATPSGEWVKDTEAEFKASRPDAVARIKVTIDGMTFDGDEISQTRMARAITASSSDTETTLWVMADDGKATVTIEQLKRALRAAGEEQTRLWIPAQN
ncbi:DUF4376 domain-containing protein [Endozoicomonas atrinae]|uniref:DUF4376 domain-containing protein n=1 Tax=Endozoicomonas atrinae TaxID=1333660 RepID=UPI0008262E50|nr:hypothetical protein [Endozoicomonas atrinae]